MSDIRLRIGYLICQYF